MGNRYLLGAALLTAGVGAGMLWFFDPASAGIFPSCPLHYLTGLYCPGCGSLRAMHQLLHGNVAAAWAMNPLTIILLPFLTYGLASEGLSLWRGAGLPHRSLPASWIWALCAVIVMFGIVRNVPVHPFDLLAPRGDAPSLSSRSDHEADRSAQSRLW
jgi:Protein of unknown function (DUF2752)